LSTKIHLAVDGRGRPLSIREEVWHHPSDDTEQSEDQHQVEEQLQEVGLSSILLAAQDTPGLRRLRCSPHLPIVA
jgi:hypothetical protein